MKRPSSRGGRLIESLRSDRALQSIAVLTVVAVLLTITGPKLSGWLRSRTATTTTQGSVASTADPAPLPPSGSASPADMSGLPPAAGPSGAFSQSIPVKTPPYYGIEPKLQISYNSQGSDGWLGVGWSLSGLSTIRRLAVGGGAPRYDSSDSFFLDGERLLPCAAIKIASPSCLAALPGQMDYATQIESFLRIALVQSPNHAGVWYVWTKTGQVRTYTSELDVLQPANGPGHDVSVWRLTGVDDLLGHHVTYTYITDPAGDLAPPVGSPDSAQLNSYLDSISYNRTVIKLYWQRRPDVVTAGPGGSQSIGTDGQSHMRFRLHTLAVVVAGNLSTTYAFHYDFRQTTSRSVLTQVQQYGSDADITGPNGDITAGTKAPPIDLLYPAIASTPAWTPGAPQLEPALSRAPSPAPSLPGIIIPTPYCHPYTTCTPFGVFTATGNFIGNGRTDWVQVAEENSANCGDLFPPSNHEIDLDLVIAKPPNETGPRVVHSVIPWPDSATLHLVGAWPADIEGDGQTDLWLALDQPTPDPRGNCSPSDTINLLPVYVDGSGHFRAGVEQQTAMDFGTDIYGNWIFPNCQPADAKANGIDDLVCIYNVLDPNTGNPLGVTDTRIMTVVSRAAGSRFDLVTSSPGVSEFQSDIAIGDVNQDGMADVLLVDPNLADLAARHNDPNAPVHMDVVYGRSNGDGTFAFTRQATGWLWSSTQYETSPFQNANVAAADLNGDGRTDLIVVPNDPSDPSKDALWIALNNGDGSFKLNQEPLPAALASVHHYLAVGDVLGNGRADLLFATPHLSGTGVGCATKYYTDVLVTRVLSRSDGTFDLPSRWDDCTVSHELPDPWDDSSDWPLVIAAPDTNGDGLADFLYAYRWSDPKQGVLAVVRDDPSPVTSQDVAAWFPADVAGRGKTDLVAIEPMGGTTRINTLLQQPNGTYVSKMQDFPAPEGDGRAVRASWRVLDVTGTGRSDLVYIRNTFQCDSTGNCNVPVTIVDTFLSNGDGTWALVSTPVLNCGPCTTATRWTVGRTTRSGRDDLIQIVQWGAGIAIYTLFGQVDGTFQSQLSSPITLAASSNAHLNSWLPIDVTGDGVTDLVEVVSFDSPFDTQPGTVSVLTILGDGQGGWSSAPIPWSSSGLESIWGGLNIHDTFNWRPSDLNGDGEADLVHATSTGTGVRIHALLSDGNGLWTPQYSDVAITPSGTVKRSPAIWSDIRNWRVASLTDDHHFSLIHLLRETNDVQIDVLGPDSAGFSFHEQSLQSIELAAGTASNNQSWRQSNVSGSGRNDMLSIDPAPNDQLSLILVRSSTADDRLARIANGLGATIDIAYASSSFWTTSPSTLECHFPVSAVTTTVVSVLASAGTSDPPSHQEFAFGCPHWSNYNGTFLGWEERIDSLARSVDRDVATTTAVYDAVEPAGVLRAREIETSNLVLTPPGGPKGPEPLFYQKTQFGYVAWPYLPFRNLVSSVTVSICNLQPRCAATTTTYQGWDDYGNPRTVVASHSGPFNNAIVSVTRLEFRYSTGGSYIVGLPDNIVDYDASALIGQSQTNGNPGGAATPPSHQLTFCYDDTCGAAPTKGQLTEVKRLDTQATGPRVDTTFLKYDSYGNIQQITNPDGYQTVITYDAVLENLPTSVCSGDLPNLCTVETWDLRFGVVTMTKDPNGGATVTKYDALGRPTLITYPSGGTETMSYFGLDGGVGNPNYGEGVRETVADGTQTGQWTTTYTDGLGRPIRVQTRGAATNLQIDLWTARDISYGDASALPYRVSNAYASSTSPSGFESYDYDGAGRLLQQTNADGTAIHYQFGTGTTNLGQVSATVTVTDETGKSVTTDAVDTSGHLVEVSQANGASPSTTEYLYDAFERQVSSIDPNGNVSSTVYNSVDEALATTSPDLGAWTYEYDPNGRLIAQTDARGVTTNLSWDAVGRITAKSIRGDTTTATTYVYDEPGHGAGLGRLTSIQDPSAQGCAGGTADQFTYGPGGLPTAWTKCIMGRALTFGFTYASVGFGRLQDLKYPDGETVAYTYNGAGQPSSLSGYVSAQLYGPGGDIVSRSYNNSDVENYSYDPIRGWLKSATVSNAGRDLYDVTYGSYQPNGLLSATYSSTDPRSNTYTYDTLGRVTSVLGSYPVSVNYDASGNITQKSDVGVYEYPKPGTNGCGSGVACPHPDAVQKAGPDAFQYDSAGNMIVRSGQSLVWNGYGELAWVQSPKTKKWTHIVYDAAGNEVYVNDDTGGPLKPDNGTGLRLYGGLAQIGTNGELTKIYVLGNQFVAASTRNVTEWFHLDELGSVRLVTNRSGSSTCRLGYDTFGTPNVLSGCAARSTIDRRYTGQPYDPNTGLTQLGDRQIDPVLGRFLSPDRFVPSKALPQSANPYTYALNDPVGLVDTNGHDPIVGWVQYDVYEFGYQADTLFGGNAADLALAGEIGAAGMDLQGSAEAGWSSPTSIATMNNSSSVPGQGSLGIAPNGVPADSSGVRSNERGWWDIAADTAKEAAPDALVKGLEFVAKKATPLGREIPTDAPLFKVLGPAMSFASNIADFQKKHPNAGIGEALLNSWGRTGAGGLAGGWAGTLVGTAIGGPPGALVGFGVGVAAGWVGGKLFDWVNSGISHGIDWYFAETETALLNRESAGTPLTGAELARQVNWTVFGEPVTDPIGGVIGPIASPEAGTP